MDSEGRCEGRRASWVEPFETPCRFNGTPCRFKGRLVRLLWAGLEPPSPTLSPSVTSWEQESQNIGVGVLSWSFLWGGCGGGLQGDCHFGVSCPGPPGWTLRSGAECHHTEPALLMGTLCGSALRAWPAMSNGLVWLLLGTLESHSRPAWSPCLVYLPELSVLGCEFSPGGVLWFEVTYSFAHSFIQSFAGCFLESRLCLKLR